MNVIVGGAVIKLKGSEVDMFKRMLKIASDLSQGTWFKDNHGPACEYTSMFKLFVKRFSEECRHEWDPDSYSIVIEEPLQANDIIVVAIYLHDHNHMIPAVGEDKPLTEFLRVLKGLLYPLVHSMTTNMVLYTNEIRLDKESRNGKSKR